MTAVTRRPAAVSLARRRTLDRALGRLRRAWAAAPPEARREFLAETRTARPAEPCEPARREGAPAEPRP